MLPGPAQEEFLWVQLIGFLIVVLSTLLYHDILVIPFFGFNQNTKKAIEEREQNARGFDDDDEYDDMYDDDDL